MNKVNDKFLSWCEDADEKTLEQIENLTRHPKMYKHVCLMPDGHAGYGMPIGGVVALTDAICPNAVGVDISCGMMFYKTTLKYDFFTKELFKEIRDKIVKKIPMGVGKMRSIPLEPTLEKQIPGCLKNILSKEEKEKMMLSLGSVGSGNHFIEIQKDQTDNVCVMLHSGSRGLGKFTCDYYNNIAKEKCLGYGLSDVVDHDLAFIPKVDEKLFNNYWEASKFCDMYASLNREWIMKDVLDILKSYFMFDLLTCVYTKHNFVSLENHFNHNVYVHRKGAIKASDELCIIPGSQGSKSYIVRGLSNKISFCSASHGAGRKQSRTASCLNLTIEQCEKDMNGIIHTDWKKVKHGKAKGEFDLSEAPAAYKDIDSVIDAEKDLVSVVNVLKPIVSIKG